MLNTGRVLEHWHTGTMTRRSYALDALEPCPFVEVHPDDLARLAMTDGQEVTVRSRRGSIRLPARASDDIQPGSVFIPFHFREAAANVLTNDELDPSARSLSSSFVRLSWKLRLGVQNAWSWFGTLHALSVFGMATPTVSAGHRRRLGRTSRQGRSLAARYISRESAASFTNPHRD